MPLGDTQTHEPARRLNRRRQEVFSAAADHRLLASIETPVVGSVGSAFCAASVGEYNRVILYYQLS